MKLEIYQVGKLPPLTVVECEKWEIDFSNVPRLKCLDIGGFIIAEFFVNNIAGFKKVVGDNESTNK